MKRSAASQPPSPPRRRKTRAAARLEEVAEQVAAKQKLKDDERAARAANSSPFESCFGIMITNGFLFRHECLWVASTSKSCNDVWEENKENLPDECLVEIKVKSNDNLSSSGLPAWMNRLRLTEETIGSTKFVKYIFDYINRLRIESKGKLTPYKRRQEEAKLVTWGGTVQVAVVRYWDKNSYNYGGLCIDMGQQSQIFNKFYFNGRSAFKCRISNTLRVWTATALGKRAWALYAKNPEQMWPLSEPEYALDTSSDSDDDSSVE